MEARIQTLAELFDTPVSYRIPVFQRPYAWRKSVQWIPLWDDTRHIAEKLLGPRPVGKIPPHFMGAIVLQLQSAKSVEVVKRIVVDGQQRLTTLQLLIGAARDSLLSLDDTERAARLAGLTENEEKHYKADPYDQTKVRQSNMNDLQSFQDVMRGFSDNGQPLRSIGEAYRYFKSRRLLTGSIRNRQGGQKELKRLRRRSLSIFK